MCTKECYMVLTRSKPFWGQFWGQICETGSRTLQSNKCAVLVSLRNTNTNITGFSHRKSPKNQYISFILRQEVVRKATLHHPSTPPMSPRETPLFGRVQGASAWYSSSQTPPQIPRLWGFCPRTAFPVQALPRRVSPVQEKPAQINNETNKILKEQIRILSYPQNIKTDFSAVILQRYIQLNTSEYNLRLHTAAIMRYNLFVHFVKRRPS